MYVFCASGDDTYAYRISFMYVHVGGGAWILNIPGDTMEVSGNDSTKLHLNPTKRCQDLKYFNLNSAT